jgi:hypothetical protein
MPQTVVSIGSLSDEGRVAGRRQPAAPRRQPDELGQEATTWDEDSSRRPCCIRASRRRAVRGEAGAQARLPRHSLLSSRLEQTQATEQKGKGSERRTYALAELGDGLAKLPQAQADLAVVSRHVLEFARALLALKLGQELGIFLREPVGSGAIRGRVLHWWSERRRQVGRMQVSSHWPTGPRARAQWAEPKGRTD